MAAQTTTVEELQDLLADADGPRRERRAVVGNCTFTWGRYEELGSGYYPAQTLRVRRGVRRRQFEVFDDKDMAKLLRRFPDEVAGLLGALRERPALTV